MERRYGGTEREERVRQGEERGGDGGVMEGGKVTRWCWEFKVEWSLRDIDILQVVPLNYINALQAAQR